MVRAMVMYEQVPDPERYAQHVRDHAEPLGVTFRHGAVEKTVVGEQKFAYYGEFEFDDMEHFRAIASTPEFAASGKDAASMGIPFAVSVVELA
jgi:hypothetical protein